MRSIVRPFLSFEKALARHRRRRSQMPPQAKTGSRIFYLPPVLPAYPVGLTPVFFLNTREK